MRKILTLLLVLLVLVSGLFVRGSAAVLPDLTRLGSVTFVMKFSGEPLTGGSLTMYKVGRPASDASRFLPVDPLKQQVVNLENLQDPALAKRLHGLAVQQKLEPITAAIREGKAAFCELEPGLYVVSQNPGEQTPGFAAIDPFLISVPQWQNNAYVYDLTAAPKVPLKPAPTEPSQPTEPTHPTDTPRLPQTGQLNWPVPVMAALGLMFFCLGWVLLLGSKRRDT